jgi:hypothetical protein
MRRFVSAFNDVHTPFARLMPCIVVASTLDTEQLRGTT